VLLPVEVFTFVVSGARPELPEIRVLLLLWVDFGQNKKPETQFLPQMFPLKLITGLVFDQKY